MPFGRRYYLGVSKIVMQSSRRAFVRGLGIAVAGGAILIGPGNLLAQSVKHLTEIPVDSTVDPLNYLRPDHFRPFIGTVMQGRSESGRKVNFTLIEITDLRHEENETRGYTGENYSLLFDGPRGAASEIYRFDHKLLGTFSLFTSPVGQSGTRYEAIVNRIAKDQVTAQD